MITTITTKTEIKEDSLPHMKDKLKNYLNSIEITSDNIGEIRRACFMPWDCWWNSFVRDETAARENKKPCMDKCGCLI